MRYPVKPMPLSAARCPPPTNQDPVKASIGSDSICVEPLLPDLKNTDRKDLLYTRLRFQVSEPEGVTAAFDTCSALEREGAGRDTWLWCSENRERKPVIPGRLVLRTPSLELECNSTRRGETGRAMIEKLAAGRIGHRSSDHENVAKLVCDDNDRQFVHDTLLAVRG